MTPSHRLLDWSELSEWQKEDNNLVESGYRIATPSLLECVASWRYLHNESAPFLKPALGIKRSPADRNTTVNIFSHLLAALLFFHLPAILIYWPAGLYAVATDGDLAVFGIYLFGVAICYTLSVIFHTLMAHSAWGSALGIQLDFQGIIILMLSATVPLAYYTFLTEPTLQKVYWALTSFFALAASTTTFTPAFREPATNPLRAGVFGSLALSALICVVHGLIVHGWNEQTARFLMWAVGLTLLFNTIGASVYVLRFPERWWRRRFDIFGASHQIMHCAIVVASLCWLAGMIRAFEHAHAGELGNQRGPEVHLRG